MHISMYTYMHMYIHVYRQKSTCCDINFMHIFSFMLICLLICSGSYVWIYILLVQYDIHRVFFV
jgi:hypothetical protein